MRIGIIVNAFPIRSQTFIVDHATELLRRGHEVVVIPLNSRTGRDWSPPPAVTETVRATEPTPGPRSLSRNPLEGLPLLMRAALPGRVRQLRFALEKQGAPRGLRHRVLLAERAARSGPFDVVHSQFAWTAPAALGMKRRGIFQAPVICSIHGQDANVTGRQHPGWLAAISEQVASMTVGSTFMRTAVEGHGVAPEKLRLWPQGVDVDREAIHLASPDGTFRVLSVHRLVEFKGADDSLRVIAAARARIPRLHYTVIGDGPLRPSLVALADELGVGDIVTFAGPRSHTEALAAHSSTDVYLQMGRTAADGSTEGQGVAPCEAAASGIPCIATRSGGLSDVIADGMTGVLTDVGDIAAAADALVRLAHDEQRRRALGEAARAFMRERFSIGATTDRIEAIYREAIESSR
ncbi:MAG TPA: glycosyltransferase family 4 protein [Acidimicrobiales bacterium]|nr:glycosyltransferase family 4 protein [Acidimicrobiales bacterium]